jgi:uncharacterized protein YjiS (DUF1127 family)
MRSRTLPARLGRRPSLLGLLRTFHALRQLRTERNHLSRLDDHLLRDIGVSRTEAEAEADRALWDAPRHWLR